jgi:hypothetical protein
MESPQDLPGLYLRFAQEARGLSPAYVTLAESVAADDVVLRFIAALPPPKQQPNLLFAAARYLLGRAADISELRRLVAGHGPELARLMRSRRTQTNEPARCASLLPALAQLPEPLALIEVGASAGLTLLFDRYSYDYDGCLVSGPGADGPTLRCALRGPVPLPDHVPDIVWRAGLDLNPLDVSSTDDVRWLTCLVWPGEADREERLAQAVAAARRDPPPVHRGDLLTDLPALAAQAPADATLVIYHSAVLTYVAPQARAGFASIVRSLGATWLSNEGPGVLPGIAVPEHDDASFVLVRDGRTPLALCGGHGSWLHWLEEPADQG